MFAPAQYRTRKSDMVLGELESRKELYDKHGQHIAITYNPVWGHKLPFLVKFPRLSSLFRRLPPGSPYRQHSEGLFNGVYYIPQKIDEGLLPIGDTVFKTKYGTVDQYGQTMDFKTQVKETWMYLALKDAYERVSENVSISSQRTVKLKSEDKLTNFRTSRNLIDNGKYVINPKFFSFLCVK